jgi:two-component system, sensor histidine kinase YesM
MREKLLINKIVKRLKKELNIRRKMFLIYIIGGFTPMLFISVFLINGTKDILIQQNKSSEISELQLIGDGIYENIRTIKEASQRLYFVDIIEKLGYYQYYNRSAELFSDYNTFNKTLRSECLSYCSHEIENICFYFANPSLSKNLNVAVINDEVAELPWFKKTLKANGRLVCAFHEDSMNYKKYLSFSRIIRTRGGRSVGVVVIAMKEERILFPLREHDTETVLVLNDEEVVYSNSDSTDEKELINLLSSGNLDKNKCQNVIYKGEDAVLTVIPVTNIGLEDKISVVSIRPYADILKKANQQSQKSILIIIGSFIIAISIISIFAWNFSSRINNFKVQMHKASRGQFDIAERIGGEDEISYLYDDLGLMINSIETLLSQVYEERVQKEMLYSRQKEMEFSMLASQINPHFLYNTLEVIRMKARANGQGDIEDIVKMLAKIMRYTLQVKDKQVTLSQELSLVESYLKIQKYRFKDRVTYSIHVNCNVEEIYTIPFILQPIVENAMVHGIEMKKGNGHIGIYVDQIDSIIRIQIIDNGVGFSEEKLKEIKEYINSTTDTSKHIGLRNVNQRVKLLFGDEYGITIESRPLVKTIVQINIPRR